MKSLLKLCIFTISINILLSGILSQKKSDKNKEPTMEELLKKVDSDNCYQAAHVNGLKFQEWNLKQEYEQTKNKDNKRLYDCKLNWHNVVEEWNASLENLRLLKGSFIKFQALQKLCKPNNDKKRRLQIKTDHCKDAKVWGNIFINYLSKLLSHENDTKSYYHDSNKLVKKKHAKGWEDETRCVSFSKREWDNYDYLKKNCLDKLYSWPTTSTKVQENRFWLDKNCSENLRKVLFYHNEKTEGAKFFLDKFTKSKCDSNRRLKSIMKKNYQKRVLQNTNSSNCHKAHRAMYLALSCLTMTSYVIKISVAAIITINAIFL